MEQALVFIRTPGGMVVLGLIFLAVIAHGMGRNS